MCDHYSLDLGVVMQKGQVCLYPEKQPTPDPFSRAISIPKAETGSKSYMPGTQCTCERHFPNPAALAGRVSGHEMFQ
jgi:hypothetical protein